MKNSDKQLFAILFCFWLNMPLNAQIQGDVLQLHASKFRWMIDRNLDSLSMLLHPKLQYIHSNGWTESRSEVIENIRSGKLVYKMVEIESTSIRKRKTRAVVVGKGTFQVSLDGSDITIRLQYEEHYKKSRKGWQLIYRISQRV
ncbi:MAG: nuclear transport factor 2 family protein [Thermaurantimonas sp.]